MDESQSFPGLKALKAQHESDTDKLNAAGSWSNYMILSWSLAQAAWHTIAPIVSVGLP